MRDFDNEVGSNVLCSVLTSKPQNIRPTRFKRTLTGSRMAFNHNIVDPQMWG